MRFAGAVTARALAAQMLDEGLDACASILGSMRSHLFWEHNRVEAEEAGVLFKTAALLYLSAMWLAQMHTYDRPGGLSC